MAKRGPDGRFRSNVAELVDRFQNATKKSPKPLPDYRNQYEAIYNQMDLIKQQQIQVKIKVSNMLDKPPLPPARPPEPAPIIVPTDPKEKLKFVYAELGKISNSLGVGYGFDLKVPISPGEVAGWAGKADTYKWSSPLKSAPFNGCSSNTLSGYGDLLLFSQIYGARYKWFNDRAIDAETLADYVCSRQLWSYNILFMMMAPGAAMDLLQSRGAMEVCNFHNSMHSDRKGMGEKGKSRLFVVPGGLLCGKFAPMVNAVMKFNSEIEIG